MGFLTGLKAWVGIGGKADDVIDTGLSLIKMGANGIDVLFDTSEEQRADRMKANAALLAHAIKVNEALASSNTASSRARRKFAGWILKNVLFVFDWCVVCISVAHLSGKSSLVANVSSMVTDIKIVTELFYIGEAMVGVIGVYFLYYGVKKAVGK